MKPSDKIIMLALIMTILATAFVYWLFESALKLNLPWWVYAITAAIGYSRIHSKFLEQEVLRRMADSRMLESGMSDTRMPEFAEVPPPPRPQAVPYSPTPRVQRPLNRPLEHLVDQHNQRPIQSSSQHSGRSPKPRERSFLVLVLGSFLMGGAMIVVANVAISWLTTEQNPTAAALQQGTPAAPGTPVLPASTQSGDLFGNPSRLCRLLEDQGLETPGWKASNAFAGEWICLTSLVDINPEAAGAGLPTNIAFYVNGTSPDRADDARVKININVAATRKAAFDQLAEATDILFRAAETPVPDALKAGLRNQKPVSVETPFGTAELIHEPGRIDSYKIVLTDRRAIVAKQAAMTGAAGLFEACRRAVARHAGYDVSLVSGNGEPIQESGYQSFSLEGKPRGKATDRFFCETHNNGTYKVKAAIGEKYPYRYIGQGNL
jgi:hypothetical protein